MSLDDEFYTTPSLLVMELSEDNFVTAGSPGTAAHRAKNKKTKTGRPERLIDVALTRSQFTTKLSSQRQFCITAHQQAQQAADDFQANNADLYNKFEELKNKGVTEDLVAKEINRI